MKTIVSIFAALAFVASVFAQQQPNMVTVDVNQLTPEARAQIEMAKTKEKIAQYGSWVGVGREVGEALDAGLTAVEKHADNIADTKIGMFAMAVIAYKVIGTDLIQLFVGLGFALLWVPFYVYMAWRNVIPHRVLTDEILDKETGKVVKRMYKNELIDDGEGRILYVVFFAILAGANCAIIFA